MLGDDIRAAGLTWPQAAARIAALHPVWLVVTYRLARAAKVRGIPAVPALLHGWARALWGRTSPLASIGPGLCVPHPHGVVVGTDVEIGARCTIYQGVTLGSRQNGQRSDGRSMPHVGDDVTIGAGAAVLGGIDVGDGASIGANAVVVHDVPAGARPTGVH